jgi:hypothetical protein
MLATLRDQLLPVSSYIIEATKINASSCKEDCTPGSHSGIWSIFSETYRECTLINQVAIAQQHWIQLLVSLYACCELGHHIGTVLHQQNQESASITSLTACIRATSTVVKMGFCDTWKYVILRKPSASHWVQKLPDDLYKPSKEVLFCGSISVTISNSKALDGSEVKCSFRALILKLSSCMT